MACFTLPYSMITQFIESVSSTHSAPLLPLRKKVNQGWQFLQEPPASIDVNVNPNAVTTHADGLITKQNTNR